jgi:hypothetical protein
VVHYRCPFRFLEPARAAVGLRVGRQRPGAIMWTLVTLVIAAVSILTIVVLGLFRLAALKRADDPTVTPQVDRWASSRDLQTPEACQ